MGKIMKFIDENYIFIFIIGFMFCFLGFILYVGMVYEVDKEFNDEYCLDKGYEFSNTNIIKEYDNQKFIQCVTKNVIINNGVASFNTTVDWVEYKP